MATVNSYDVAIVGYGPGAQCLAALLGRRGHRVVAFERYPHLYNLPRAGHIDHEALRMVQSVGDADRLAETLWEVRDDYVWVNAGGEQLMLQPAHTPEQGAVSGWYSDYTQWQPNLENALDTAAREAGVDVRLGWEAVGLQQGDRAVDLVASRVELDDEGRLSRTEEYQRVRASYVIGVDGASSFVRTNLGIERDDVGFNERWLDVDMKTLSPIVFAPNIGQICDPARPRMLMPLGRSHRRFEWMVLPGEDDAVMEDPGTAWKLLEEFGVTPESHEIARQIVYVFQARMARTWRDGRVLISGDAAHTMPPYAGQGLLSSLRDSNNLAWKLDLVLRGFASDALLDTFEEERRPHVQTWTNISLAEGRVSCELDPRLAGERDARMLAGEKLEHVAPPTLHGRLVQSRVGDSVAGTLCLQGRIRTADAEGRFDDLLGPSRFQVLTTGASAESVLSPEQLHRLTGLDAIVAEVLPAGAQPRAGAVVDLEGRYETYFREHDIEAVVARPDFYVFGSVHELSGLPALIDELFTRLYIERVGAPSSDELTHA
jgi:2-polyprenyl-6-methoxyphenol hydroxylase-like FAD-dependent oxidoreductase